MQKYDKKWFISWYAYIFENSKLIQFFFKWMRYFEIAFFQMFLFWHKMPTKQVSIHSSWQLLCMNLNFPLFWDFVGRIVTIQASLFPINKKGKESLVSNFNRTSITYQYHTYIRLTHPDSHSVLPDFFIGPFILFSNSSRYF